ncbi:MAG: hypothetical protein ACE5ER_12090 [Nitrospinaceae bacterium]
MKLGVFRDELPGERKSIINTLMWGWLLILSILGYLAFYLTIQLGQVERLLQTLPPGLSGDEFLVLQSRLMDALARLKTEIQWLAVLGGVFAIIGGIYTYNLVVRPLRKLVQFAEGNSTTLPEIKTNNEIKQLITALTAPPAAQEDDPKRSSRADGPGLPHAD